AKPTPAARIAVKPAHSSRFSFPISQILPLKRDRRTTNRRGDAPRCSGNYGLCPHGSQPYLSVRSGLLIRFRTRIYGNPGVLDGPRGPEPGDGSSVVAELAKEVVGVLAEFWRGTMDLVAGHRGADERAGHHLPLGERRQRQARRDVVHRRRRDVVGLEQREPLRDGLRPEDGLEELFQGVAVHDALRVVEEPRVRDKLGAPDRRAEPLPDRLAPGRDDDE